MSYTLIERKELSNATSSISFENIPQHYTDLLLFTSLRSTGVGTGAYFAFNGSTANFAGVTLQGSGASVNSPSDPRRAGYTTGSEQTTSTFANNMAYILNYSSNQFKSYSVDHVQENNGTISYQGIFTGAWNQTAAINSITITNPTGDMAQYSSASLYGINRQQAIGAPKAVGGQISFANGLWYHAFTGSGTFFAKEAIDCEYLVIAGGGGGGFDRAGGGGGGGYRSSVLTEISGGGGSIEPKLSLSANTSHIVTVGSGGPGGNTSTPFGTNGVNSTFGSIVSIGGGGGAYGFVNAAPRSGGSGGGSGGQDGGFGLTGGAGTTNQGFKGGNGIGSPFHAGGGGGASSVGANATGSGGGNGGSGLLSNITGTLVGRAGGGGGARNATSGGTSGSGFDGGGNAGVGNGGAGPTSGATNTGGGGGGGSNNPTQDGAAGGSGIVIIRYKA